MTQSWPQFESPQCRQGERVPDPAVQMDLSLQVGKYDVQKAIGKGATGTVYLARDTFTGREVALKTIEPEVFRDPEFGTVYRSQFQNEASLAGKLRHPHIVAILDAVVQKDSGHIAMEYVEGGDLSRHDARDKLRSEEHTSELQSPDHLVCRLLLEKKKNHK